MHAGTYKIQGAHVTYVNKFTPSHYIMYTDTYIHDTSVYMYNPLHSIDLYAYKDIPDTYEHK